MGSRGWYSRGYLPHFDALGLLQAITFRLGDSLPQSVLTKMDLDYSHLPDGVKERERARRFNQELDKGYGRCWLQRADIAEMVERRLLESDGDSCKLLAWSIMPNHIHVLCEPADDLPLFKLVKEWKGSTAFAANRILGIKGQFWSREYHDRYIRDEAHLHNILKYIDDNPVKAGLCREPMDWPYGSARFTHSAE